jgi:hypothetical protein
MSFILALFAELFGKWQKIRQRLWQQAPDVIVKKFISFGNS